MCFPCKIMGNVRKTFIVILCYEGQNYETESYTTYNMYKDNKE